MLSTISASGCARLVAPVGRDLWPAAASGPVVASDGDAAHRLATLTEMRDTGLITAQEHEATRAEILREL